jgi:hypothetical protein
VVKIEIDNRGLTLPEPMERVISALQTLRDEDELAALLDREPLLLFPELERRGYAWECAEAGTHFVVTIRRLSWD